MAVTSNREINYLSKDFDSIKADLMDYVKRHFPSDWRDFNDASGGMALLELIAYVGDILSFNIDRQVNEAYINRAVELKNIVSLAQNFGYKPKNNTPAVVNLSLSADFTESTSAETPDTLTVVVPPDVLTILLDGFEKSTSLKVSKETTGS